MSTYKFAVNAGEPRGTVLLRLASTALLAIGRAIGWIGHAIAQYQEEHIMRPRARYVGMQPAAVAASASSAACETSVL